MDELRAAIARSEDALARMSAEAQERGICQCCVGAFYGGTEGRYDRLAAKIDRQWGWLAVLLAKRGQGDLQAASRRYQKLARHRPRALAGRGEAPPPPLRDPSCGEP